MEEGKRRRKVRNEGNGGRKWTRLKKLERVRSYLNAGNGESRRWHGFPMRRHGTPFRDFHEDGLRRGFGHFRSLPRNDARGFGGAVSGRRRQCGRRRRRSRIGGEDVSTGATTRRTGDSDDTAAAALVVVVDKGYPRRRLGVAPFRLGRRKRQRLHVRRRRSVEILDGTLAPGDGKSGARDAINVRPLFRIHGQHVLDEGVNFRRVFGVIRHAELPALDGESRFAERQREEAKFVEQDAERPNVRLGRQRFPAVQIHHFRGTG